MAVYVLQAVRNSCQHICYYILALTIGNVKYKHMQAINLVYDRTSSMHLKLQCGTFPCTVRKSGISGFNSNYAFSG